GLMLTSTALWPSYSISQWTRDTVASVSLVAVAWLRPTWKVAPASMKNERPRSGPAVITICADIGASPGVGGDNWDQFPPRGLPCQRPSSPKRERDAQPLAGTEDVDLERVADQVLPADVLAQVVGVLAEDRLAVHAQDDVATPDPGGLGSGVHRAPLAE